MKTIWSEEIPLPLDDRVIDGLSHRLGLTFHGTHKLGAATIAHRFFFDDGENGKVLVVRYPDGGLPLIQLLEYGTVDAPHLDESLRTTVREAIESLQPATGPRRRHSTTHDLALAPYLTVNTYRSLSVIIPVFNEERTIAEVVRRLRRVELPIELNIVVIDDGSWDGTSEILKALEYDGMDVIRRSNNAGKGAAIRTGLEHARGDLVLVQDADLEYDPEDLPKLLAPLLKGRAQVVYGSRLTGERRNMSFLAMVGNRLVTLATNVLYNTTLSDMSTGYKVFDRRALEGIKLRSDGFDIDAELTAKLLRRGHRIYEVPISYTGREVSEGKKSTDTDSLRAIWTLARYRFWDDDVRGTEGASSS